MINKRYHIILVNRGFHKRTKLVRLVLTLMAPMVTIVILAYIPASAQNISNTQRKSVCKTRPCSIVAKDSYPFSANSHYMYH